MATAGRQLRPYERRKRIYGALASWVFVVALYFLWEAVTYTGLYGWLSEREYAAFGWAMPVLTFTIWTGLFGAIGLLLLVRRKHHRDDLELTEAEHLALERAARFRSVLLGLAGAFTVAAVAALLWTLTLPNFGPPARDIVVGDRAGMAWPQSGPAKLHGDVDYAHAARFTQSLIVTQREVWFAPVLAPSGKDKTIRYFVELPPDIRTPGHTFDLHVPRTGILQHNGLPGSIRSMYDGVGMPVQQPNFVLYLSPSTVRWPYYIIAGQFAVAGLIALLIAGFQHRHVRRQVGRQQPATAPA